MKIITGVAALLVSGFLFAQKIEIPPNKDLLAGQIINLKISEATNGPYLLELKEGTTVGIDQVEMIQPVTYEDPGVYVLKLIDGSGKMVALKNLKVIDDTRSVKILGYLITEYNPVKSSGEAWDNSWGGTYPDIKVSLSIDGKQLENMTKTDPTFSNSTTTWDIKQHDNVKTTDLPIERLYAEPITVLRKNLVSKKLRVYAFDVDSISGSDTMLDVDVDGTYLLLNKGKIPKTDTQRLKLSLLIEIE